MPSQYCLHLASEQNMALISSNWSLYHKGPKFTQILHIQFAQPEMTWTYPTSKERQVSCFALGHDARSSHQHDRQSIEISGMRRHNEDGSVLSRRLLAPHSDPVETPKQEEQPHDPAHQCLRIATTKHHHTWLLDQNRTGHNTMQLHRRMAYLLTQCTDIIKGCFNFRTFSYYCTRLNKASFSPGRKSMGFPDPIFETPT